MKIVCSSDMPFAAEAFGTLGETLVADGRTLTAETVRDADILAIRSTTKAGPGLLAGSRVRFVGTATIGFDHMDTGWLEKAGIRWCYSPGCNANSVSEYVVSALLCLANRHGFALRGRTIGVIGVGNVGTLVARKAEALGMRVLRNDPPKEREQKSEVRGQKSEGRGQRAAASAPQTRGSGAPGRAEEGTRNAERRVEYAGLERVLAESDVVTMHVPLTKEGPDATDHMAGPSFFGRMKPGCVFLNTARGPVVVTDALLDARQRGTVAHTVIDTWEGEPAYRRDLLDRADLGTPHIAGYSFEGKVAGTLMVYREACRFLGVEPSWSPEGRMPAPEVPFAEVEAGERAEEAVLWDAVRRVYDIEADDRRLREGNVEDAAARGRRFDRLRIGYPVRREFRFTEVRLRNAKTGLRERFAGLGFAVAQFGIVGSAAGG